MSRIRIWVLFLVASCGACTATVREAPAPGESEPRKTIYLVSHGWHAGIVLGRAEAFAMRHGVIASGLDGIGNGLGYTVILLLVGAVRELFGHGSLLGVQFLWTKFHYRPGT